MKMKAFRKLWLIPSFSNCISLAELQQSLRFIQPQPRLFSSESAFPAIMGAAENKPTFPSLLDFLSLDAVELQSLFAAQKLTSAQLVKKISGQIRN
jgi:hypothetical protein